MSDDEFPADVRGYHRRTKHAPQRYALGPAFLDWESQPNGFRRYEGARLVELPLRYDAPTPAFERLGEGAAQALSAATLGLFLELAFGVSAWKEAGEARWALRNNPSSGNLHPTEAWVVLPAIAGIAEGPGLFHYASREHGLEERCRLTSPPAALPEGGFLLALSSVPWREAWKYGERSFRYCQHDVGHAFAAAAYAAACVGWGVRILTRPGDATLGRLLGLERDDASHAYEREHADLVAVVGPGLPAEPALDVVEGEWFGRANRLSDDHDAWPVVDLAARFTVRAEGAGAAGLAEEVASAVVLGGSGEPAGAVIRRRRSAQRMKKGSGIDRAAFFRMLSATMPGAALPWRGFPWAPRIALALFVHQVEGLAPGIYALVRDPASLSRLKAALGADFAWAAVPDCPLPLFVLAIGEIRAATSKLSCLQAIAGNGAFSLGMLADFERTLGELGDWAYRRLHWEAGAIGQALYLEATAAGIAGTGIGCFFDDAVHAFLGMREGDGAWQTIYHFTVGEALEDARISTLPAYRERATGG